MNVEATLNGLTHHGAGWVLWVLVGSSVAGLALALERGLVFAGTRVDPRRLERELLAEIDRGRTDLAARRLSESRAFEARLGRVGLEAESREVLDAALAATSTSVRLELERGVGWLGSIASTAPFVGLLGTVIGVLRAFGELGRSGGRVTGPLMAEIGEALLATAVGLCVALPALVAFNAFTRLVEVRVGRGHALALGLFAAAAQARTHGADAGERPAPGSQRAGGGRSS